MKKLLILIFIVLSYFGYSQTTINLGDFNTIKIYDKLKVKLISSSENKVIIYGTRQDEVVVINKKGELKLRMPSPVLKTLSDDEISINLFFKKIASIQVGQGSYVFSNEIFKQTSIYFNANSGAEIHLDLDVKNANVRAVTGGIIELFGTATNQDVIVSTGGDFKAKELITSQTKINVSVGGNAVIDANLLVDATVKTGGTLYIYGKPKQVNKETILGGTIIEK